MAQMPNLSSYSLLLLLLLLPTRTLLLLLTTKLSSRPSLSRRKPIVNECYKLRILWTMANT